MSVSIRSRSPGWVRARRLPCDVPDCILSAVDEVFTERHGNIGVSCRSHVPTFGMLDDSYWRALDDAGGQFQPAAIAWRAQGGKWDAPRAQKG